MSSDYLALAEYIDRPKGLADSTTAAIWPVRGCPHEYMGLEIVKIACGESMLPESGEPHDGTKSGYFSDHISSTFAIHKSLLCRYSRYFRERLYGSLETELVAEALLKIESSPNKYLSYEAAPAGYVPSWVAFVEDYRRKLQESDLLAETEQSFIGEQQADEIIQLPGELKADFVIFAHWLYTQRVDLDDYRPHGFNEVICTRMYNLAERLDAPALRRQCYEALRKHYVNNNTMPEPEVVQVIIKSRQGMSLLRKYMVATIAHEIITNGSESKESCDPILALNKDFAAEVAVEIMDRLRSDESLKDPNDEEKFDMDDSDSDVSSSIDVGSAIDYDSDGYMTISDGEEEESVIGDMPEKPLAVEEVPQSSSELSYLESDHNVNVLAPTLSPTYQKAPRVKIEVHSSPDRALLDVNANKRKRVSHVSGDDENPPLKRLETWMTNDSDFVDLTQWANSD